MNTTDAEIAGKIGGIRHENLEICQCYPKPIDDWVAIVDRDETEEVKTTAPNFLALCRAVVDKVDGEPKIDNADKPLTCEIVNQELRIGIGVKTLAFATENTPDAGLWGDYVRVKVTDNNEWAKDILRELEKEQEDGTNEVHLLLERAMRKAVNNGSASVSLSNDKEPI